MKNKKDYVTYLFIQNNIALGNGGGGILYAVNKTQYEKLIALEGQTVILDESIGIIENVAEKLKLINRLKRNYIIWQTQTK